MGPKFEETLSELLEERSMKNTTREMFPRGISQSGGFSSEFLGSLKKEVKRLRSKNEKLQTQHILKGLKFEINEMD